MAVVDPDPTPSPAPASDIRAITPPLGRRRSLEEARAYLAAHPDPDADAMREADLLYGDDDDRMIEDIKAGHHPAQRGGKNLDVYERVHAEIAELRAKRR